MQTTLKLEAELSSIISRYYLGILLVIERMLQDQSASYLSLNSHIFLFTYPTSMK